MEVKKSEKRIQIELDEYHHPDYSHMSIEEWDNSISINFKKRTDHGWLPAIEIPKPFFLENSEEKVFNMKIFKERMEMAYEIAQIKKKEAKLCQI